MTSEMEALMYLYAAGAQGVSAAPPAAEIRWDVLQELAQRQGVCNELYYALKCSDALPLPPAWRAALLGACLRREKQVAALVALLGRMEAAGLHPVVLKGFAAARLYACPDARGCADTDILIAPDEEQAALAFLSTEGFSCKPRRVEQNHSECSHAAYGLIELHISLFSPLFAGTVFANASPVQSAQRVCLPVGSYHTLAPADALLFCSLHLIKHFLYSGFNLRMLMDVALQSKSCTREERAALTQKLEELGFVPLFSAVCGILTRFCGFAADALPALPPCPDELVCKLAEDLELACWNPQDIPAERVESWLALRNRRLQASCSQVRRVSRQVQRAEQLRSLFPPRAQMVKKYPCLHKYALLTPFCWLHRLFCRGIPHLLRAKRRAGLHAPALPPETARRLALFHSLGLDVC